MPQPHPVPPTRPLARLPARDAANPNKIHVVVDTPKGSRHKYKFDEDLRVFRLEHVLGAGLVFPSNFGYIPATRGEDGDPLDVLLLMDDPVFVGCLVVSRLIGVIEASQVEVGARRAERNDRLLAVPFEAPEQAHLRRIDQVAPVQLDEIEHFFVAYTSLEGKRFTPQHCGGPARGHHLLAQGIKAFETNP